VKEVSAANNANNQDVFDIRPAAVKLWVDHLPLGSTGETSKQLYHALKKVNLQKNSLNLHLEFLEAIGPTLTLIYPRLSKYFTDISLPLDQKTKNVLHVTSSLLHEVLSGYQFISKTLMAKKPFGWKKPFALSSHRIFTISSQILSTQRLSYQPNVKGVWRELYWSYQQANDFNILSKTFCINTDDDKKNKSSVDYEFKKLILLSLLSTSDLDKNSIKDIYNLMPFWIKHIDISKTEPKDKKTCFTLNLLSDSAPYLIGTRKDSITQNADRYFLSSFKLKDVLNKYISKIESNDGVIRIANNILSKPSIQVLLSCWSRNQIRTEVRTNGTGFVDIVTGINAIHFVLSQQEQPAYDEVSTDFATNITDFESTLTIEPIKEKKLNDTLSLQHFLGTSEEEEDVWGKVFESSINERLPEAHWTESTILKVFTFTKSILLDYSKDGYRLSVNAQKVDSLKHNELVAVREHALAPWALAQVKWLHFTEKGDLQFGVQILSHHVLPVHISYQANNTFSKPLPCLLGLDTQKLMLFVPTLPTSLNGKKLKLDHNKQHSHIHLKNKVITTTAFDVYEIYETQSGQQTNHKIAVEPVVSSESKTHLNDSIWENF